MNLEEIFVTFTTLSGSMTLPLKYIKQFTIIELFEYKIYISSYKHDCFLEGKCRGESAIAPDWNEISYEFQH